MTESQGFEGFGVSHLMARNRFHRFCSVIEGEPLSESEVCTICSPSSPDILSGKKPGAFPDGFKPGRRGVK
jgi:hypothetical protein